MTCPRAGREATTVERSSLRPLRLLSKRIKRSVRRIRSADTKETLLDRPAAVRVAWMIDSTVRRKSKRFHLSAK